MGLTVQADLLLYALDACCATSNPRSIRDWVNWVVAVFAQASIIITQLA